MPQPIVPELHLPGDWGITREPQATEYFQLYLDALGEHLREGMVVLDYGCGCARLANYLSARLDQFVYYGIEQDNEFGRWSIDYAAHLFGRDMRVHLGVAGSGEEQEALLTAEVAILSSVFTHVPFFTFERIMQRLAPVWERGGTVVFSCFLAEPSYEFGPGHYGPGTYAAAFYRLSELQDWAAQHGVQLVEVAGVFIDFMHVLFRVERLPVESAP